MRKLNRIISFPFLTSYKKRTKRKHAINQIEKAGVWFVDIPRTGSTSIKTSLSKSFGNEFGKKHRRETNIHSTKYTSDHMTAIEVRKLVGKKMWDSLYTFSVVRNPWARMYSIFQYRKGYGDIAADLSFDSYLRILERNDTRHQSSPYHYHFYFIPMCDFIMDKNNNVLVNDIFNLKK